ncbi:ThuA domain-containing protein [Labilibacter marinus]|uniref:ThuA domain-containing protein n=1 Tax=Labilibacter marinus TaxID=1477105 RepID=UPI00094FDA0D|nr:ThuA domain-containing protein [Labilibacter marinus]
MNKALLIVVFIIFSLVDMCAQDQFKLLLFTHHDEWHSECIPAAVQAFEKMSEENQFHFDWTQLPKELETKLPEYDIVVFVNANTDVLDSAQIQALKRFVNRGGGFVGIHAASAAKIRNEWFDGLIGGVFTNHPKFQTALVEVKEGTHPSVLHLPQKWLWSDEWYNFEKIEVDKLNVVLTVDETSYDYSAGYDDIPLSGMGDEHPIAWYHEYEGGRVFYTSLGHKPEVYKNNNFLKHILGAIYWTLNEK